MSRDTGYLTPRVLDELERLHGHLPENFQPREWIVTTPAGEYPVPPSVQAHMLSDLERSTAAIEFGRACAWGDVEKVRAALEGGIGTGELGQSGLTPLHLATFSRSPETVQILLDAGADPNAVLTDTINDDDVWSTYCETYRSRTTNGDPVYRVTEIDPLCCFMDEGETPLHRALKNFRGMDDIDGARASLLEMVRLSLFQLIAAGQ